MCNLTRRVRMLDFAWFLDTVLFLHAYSNDLGDTPGKLHVDNMFLLDNNSLSQQQHQDPLPLACQHHRTGMVFWIL